MMADTEQLHGPTRDEEKSHDGPYMDTVVDQSLALHGVCCSERRSGRLTCGGQGTIVISFKAYLTIMYSLT